jgi:hypothetical protein
MTPTRVAAIVAIVTSVGLASFTPAMAEGPRDNPREVRQHRMDFRAGDHGRFNLAQFTCAPRAVDRMERRFNGLAERLNLSAEQKTLYTTFTTSALTAQTTLADKCAELRPAPTADKSAPKQRPDLIQRMESQLKFDEARLAAMTAVMPDFKAFYTSLSDDQKGNLFQRGGKGHGKEPGKYKGKFHHKGN